MTPEMRARITAQNDTGPAFGEVARDAQMSAQKVNAAGQHAAAGLRAESTALDLMRKQSRLAATQSQNLLFQLNDLGVQIASGGGILRPLIQQGSQIATIWSPEQGGVGRAFAETGNIAKNMVTKFWPIAAVAGAIAINVAALTNEVNRNQKAHASWQNVVKASWQVFAEGMMEKVKPATDWLGGIWDSITPKFTDNITAIIKSFDLGFRNIKSEWQLLPAALGESAIGAAQKVIDSITWMGRQAVGALNTIIAQANGLLDKVGLPHMNQLGNPNDLLPDVKLPNPFAGAGTDLQKQLAQNYLDVANTDPLGAIRQRALALQAADDAAKNAKTSVNKLGHDGIGKLKDQVSVFAEAAKSAFDNLGTGLIEAFRKGGNIAGNVLDMLLDRVGQLGESLLNSGLNSLLQMGINSIFTIGNGLAPIPTGGFFPGLTGPRLFAAGGVANAPSIFGESGPEAAVPLPDGRTIPVTLRGKSGDTVNHYHIDARGAQEGVGPQIARAIDDFEKHRLPSRVQEINASPRRR